VDKTILLQVFEEAVLKDSDGERKVGLYEISRVLEPGYAFIHSSTEQIQRIILSEAKFVRQHGAWHTISIGRDGTNKQMEADLFLLRDFLVNAKLYQVTLYFVFPGKTKRGKAEKVILTDGKECQLGNTYKHQLIKKHLTDYKIRYVASI
jgi:hypothetical protein